VRTVTTIAAWSSPSARPAHRAHYSDSATPDGLRCGLVWLSAWAEGVPVLGDDGAAHARRSAATTSRTAWGRMGRCWLTLPDGAEVYGEALSRRTGPSSSARTGPPVTMSSRTSRALMPGISFADCQNGSQGGRCGL
jgi:hypothetical protein